MSPSGFRSGFVAIVGRPNVGKSTLLNRVVGQKVTIVSDKPQTTRNRIQCVWTTDEAQIVFLDTPGFHKPQDRLGEKMMEAARESLEEVDAVLFVTDGPGGPGRGDSYVAGALAPLRVPVILVINKADRLSQGEREEALASFASLGAFHRTLLVSALTAEGVRELLEEIVAILPEGPKYYPDDWVVDHPEQFVVAELIREKALHLTREEVPHAVAVEIESMARRAERDLVEIRAHLYVERESQKGIVIGKGGRLLKEIGTRARAEIEALLGSPVFLDIRVKVRPDWREKESALRSLGYR